MLVNVCYILSFSQYSRSIAMSGYGDGAFTRFLPTGEIVIEDRLGNEIAILNSPSKALEESGIPGDQAKHRSS